LKAGTNSAFFSPVSSEDASRSIAWAVNGQGPAKLRLSLG